MDYSIIRDLKLLYYRRIYINYIYINQGIYIYINHEPCSKGKYIYQNQCIQFNCETNFNPNKILFKNFIIFTLILEKNILESFFH